MDFLAIVVIALGLSMDAFAAAIGKGLDMKKIDYKWSFTVALFFGGFQALMPVIGWSLGEQFDKYITDYDHWIAFFLLVFIGGKMIIESFKHECEVPENNRSFKELIVLSVATSIDALAVGLSFALLNMKILFSAIIIGIITFGLSFLGVILGYKFGCKYKDQAELFGGVILILIGLKILFEHLNIF